jgi:hypothetical protein
VFQGKRPGRRVWALHRTVLDRIILRALGLAGVEGQDVSAAGNVQPVRRSVAGYLSKYLSKGSDLSDLCLDLLELVLV